MSADDFKDGLIAEIPNLRAFAASLSGSMQLADDLVQDTLLKAWGNAEKFQPGTSLRARKTGPACTPGMKPGFTTCRSPAPWP